MLAFLVNKAFILPLILHRCRRGAVHGGNAEVSIWGGSRYRRRGYGGNADGVDQLRGDPGMMKRIYACTCHSRGQDFLFFFINALAFLLFVNSRVVGRNTLKGIC